MSVKPEKKSIQPLKDKAYEHIQNKLLAGELPVGGPVSELVISRELGMSRTPVREALGQLIAEGFLEQIPNRGTVVKQLTRNDIVELYELREALEVYAVGKAAQQTPEMSELQVLEKLCDEITVLADGLEQTGGRRLSEIQMQRFVAIDFHFHMLLLRAAGNRRILKVVSGTRLLIRIFSISRDGHDSRLLREIYKYHRGILDAVAAGDATKAQQVMGQHIRQSRQERLDDHDREERNSHIRLAYPLPPDLHDVVYTSASRFTERER